MHDTKDRIQAEMATEPKQIVNMLDPDVQILILRWVVPCLVEDYLNRHHELKPERQIQYIDTTLIGADGLHWELHQ